MRGQHLEKLDGGLVMGLWEQDLPKDFEFRAYCHVADYFAVYCSAQGYLLEFTEWNSLGKVFRALRLSYQPSRDQIKTLFFDRTTGGSWCFEMMDFDDLSDEDRPGSPETL
ncbi:MAG: hypothetical protein WC314_21040 [Vulcanimicrobiota bacterium]